MEDPTLLIPASDLGSFTPGIAPASQTSSSNYHGILPLWLHNALQAIVGGPAAQSMAPSAAPAPPANQTPAQAAKGLGEALSPSPGTQKEIDQTKTGVANQGIQALWDKASSLPIFQSQFWQHFGVYGILVALFLIGIVLLVTGAKGE